MKRSQGEIFGLALMFVVLILGIVIFAKMKALNPDAQKDLIKEGKYKILAESVLNSALRQSTGCYSERNKDSVIDLIQFCLYNHNVNFDEVFLTCENGARIDSCTYPIKILNETLFNLFNNSNNYYIPFYLSIDLPSSGNAQTSLNNRNVTNFGYIFYKGESLTKSNYRKNGFNKAPSGLISYPTSYRNIDFELGLYYR